MTVQPFSRIELELTLPVVSPCLFRGLPGKLMGLDASALRDEKGRPVIPGDQVRGCLRDAFEDLAAAGADITADDLLDLFGRRSPSENEAGAANIPSRGWLNVSDLTAVGLDGSQPIETTRIAIDDRTGTAKEGMIQVLELVARFGTPVIFKGYATLFVPYGADNAWTKRIDQALKLVTAIGSVKSAGFGEVIDPSAKLQTSSVVTIRPANPVTGSRRYRVTFDRPLLVDADLIADNAMAGSAVIPGAVFKGALAQALGYAGEDPEQGAYSSSLSALSFSVTPSLRATLQGCPPFGRCRSRLSRRRTARRSAMRCWRVVQRG
jgi:hypothetical protein